MTSKNTATVETTVKAKGEPKRVQNDTRMILHVEGAHGQRYRDWCAANGVTVRHGLGKLHEQLDASWEARGVALQQRDDWRNKYTDALGETEAVRRDGELKIADLQGRLDACRRQIAECEELRRAAVERADKLEREAAMMTAWDHVRAAVGKSGLGGRFVAAMIGLSLLGNALQTINIVWGML